MLTKCVKIFVSFVHATIPLFGIGANIWVTYSTCICADTRTVIFMVCKAWVLLAAHVRLMLDQKNCKSHIVVFISSQCRYWKKKYHCFGFSALGSSKSQFIGQRKVTPGQWDIPTLSEKLSTVTTSVGN